MLFVWAYCDAFGLTEELQYAARRVVLRRDVIARKYARTKDVLLEQN